MVGTSGLEPPTSRLSGVRSNQLSYAPLYAARFFVILRQLPSLIQSHTEYAPSFALSFPSLTKNRLHLASQFRLDNEKCSQLIAAFGFALPLCLLPA